MSLGALDRGLAGAVVVVQNTLRRRGEEFAGFGCHVYTDYGVSPVRRIGWTERHRG